MLAALGHGVSSASRAGVTAGTGDFRAAEAKGDILM
ncbi:hypothetical protein MFUL124B02_09500 [Myxococcus fulvus 124B02]|nr:hypothetical protein MFUL124B02_09500 [Myxococcus fulvus 124B02]